MRRVLPSYSILMLLCTSVFGQEYTEEDLQRRHTTAYPISRLHRDWIYQDHGLKSGECFVAADGNGVELKKLYVARDERRHKLGHRLTCRVEEAARARGKAFVELWSDVKFDAAHRFYEARGYQRDGRTRELGDASDTVEYYFRLDLQPSRGSKHD